MVDGWSIDKHQKDGQYFDTRGARVETSTFCAYWRMYVVDHQIRGELYPKWPNLGYIDL